MNTTREFQQSDATIRLGGFRSGKHTISPRAGLPDHTDSSSTGARSKIDIPNTTAAITDKFIHTGLTKTMCDMISFLSRSLSLCDGEIVEITKQAEITWRNQSLARSASLQRVNKVWEKAAEHFCGQGLEMGAPSFDGVQSALQLQILNKKFPRILLPNSVWATSG